MYYVHAVIPRFLYNETSKYGQTGGIHCREVVPVTEVFNTVFKLSPTPVAGYFVQLLSFGGRRSVHCPELRGYLYLRVENVLVLW